MDLFVLFNLLNFLDFTKQFRLSFKQYSSSVQLLDLGGKKLVLVRFVWFNLLNFLDFTKPFRLSFKKYSSSVQLKVLNLPIYLQIKLLDLGGKKLVRDQDTTEKDKFVLLSSYSS